MPDDPNWTPGDPRPAQAPPKPVTDLSPRVVRIARVIDRLEPGHYVIDLTKPQVKGDRWVARFVRQDDHPAAPDREMEV